MNIEKIVDPDSKFNTCNHRSDAEIEHVIKRCSCQGGNYVVKGFFCNKRNIIKVTEDICKDCHLYESK